MMYFHSFILHLLQAFKQERTIFSVYHLVKGKKSSQTIQDAFLFQVTPYFFTFPHLKRKEFNDAIWYLVNENYIEVNQNQQYRLLKQPEHTEEHFPYLDGLQYKNEPFVFWKRINLLVQVLSCNLHGEKKYLPVQRDLATQNWVKKIVATNKHQLDTVASSLYAELHALCSNQAIEDPALFISRLSGYAHIGYTQKQASVQFGLDETVFHLKFLHLLHYFIKVINQDEFAYPYLSLCLNDISQSLPITYSTYQTFMLINKGYAMEDIAQERRLKIPTIEDHIIELAHYKLLPSYTEFITNDELKDIQQVAKHFGFLKLKPLKEKLPHMSYFQIRLALAEMKGKD